MAFKPRTDYLLYVERTEKEPYLILVPGLGPIKKNRVSEPLNYKEYSLDNWRMFCCFIR